MARPFNSIQRRFLGKFAEALFDGYVDMAVPVETVVADMEHMIANIGGTKQREITIAVGVLQLAMVPFFNRLSVAKRRERIFERLQSSEIDIVQDLSRLRSLIYAAYYGHWQDGGNEGNESNPVLKQIGFTLPHKRVRTDPPDLKIERVLGREIDPLSFVKLPAMLDDFDVIVIGSGSGGAVSAYNLARHGHKVLIIEAGPHYPSERITHEERLMAARLFKHGALQSTTDRDFIVFQGRNVGGSPTVNNGICLRMKNDPLGHPDTSDIFANWTAMGAHLNEAKFQQAYDDVQNHLGIAPAEQRSGKGNGNHLLDAWNAYAAASTDPVIKASPAGWFSKNFGPPNTPQACAYCGYCNTGCPYARKLGMAQSYLPDAGRLGAKILAETKVENILWKKLPGGYRRAIGVAARGPGGKTVVIPARKGVVVAAGTITSSLLLDRSGVEGTGRDISLNVASPVVALMPNAGHPSWDEDQMTTAVDCRDYLLESHFQPPMSMASLMSGWFGEMDRRMRLYNRQRSAGILFPADRRGSLVGGKLKVKLTEGDLKLARRALITLTQVHFAGGAEEVWPPLLKGQTLKPGDNIKAFYDNALREADDATLSSSHPHGGNPINADPLLGVVDTQCRVHGVENVLVTDASVFPSCIKVNAQFTTMAMAQYATVSDPF